MNKFLNKLFFSAFLFVILLGTSSVYGEDYAQIEIDLKNIYGDRVSASNVSFKVYEYKTDSLYTELKPKAEYPFFVTSLPMNQIYRLEGFVNGIFAGYSIIKFQNNYELMDFVFPKTSGMNVKVLYNDDYTPIGGATVTLKNQDNNIIRKNYSDENGNTLRFSISPTLIENDFYQFEVSLDQNITHTTPPIRISPGLTKDLKITTPWPKILDSLITIYAYNSDLEPITSVKGKYVAELYDKENNLVARTEINARAEANFSNTPVGNYRLIIKDIDKNQLTYFVNKTVTVLGDTNEIEVISNQFLGLNSESEHPEFAMEEDGSEIISCNCIAFRLDDIQDYWINDVQMEIMDIFKERKLPLTIGIIANEIGEDPQIISYITQNIPNNQLEIANHGWTHEDFTKFDKETQSKSIKNSNEKIQRIFGVTPVVFIPPYNEYNNDTIYAMNENGITHFSSSTTISNPPYPLMDKTLYNFPTSASTGELSLDNSLFEGINHKLTITQIENSISEYGFAVVMMHPQDFAVIEGKEHLNQINWNQIRELELLLDRIKILGLDIVPISKIDLDPDFNKLPSWVQQMSQWWSEGKISVEEYENGIKFYQENGIINI